MLARLLCILGETWLEPFPIRRLCEVSQSKSFLSCGLVGLER